MWFGLGGDNFRAKLAPRQLLLILHPYEHSSGCWKVWTNLMMLLSALTTCLQNPSESGIKRMMCWKEGAAF